MFDVEMLRLLQECQAEDLKNRENIHNMTLAREMVMDTMQEREREMTNLREEIHAIK